MAKTLLILDDDINLRSALASGFSKLGYQVTESIGTQFWQPFEYAVVDLRMGSENGLDSIKKLLTLNKNCKIIVLTGYGSIVTAVEAIKAGAKNYIRKPASIKTIESALIEDNLVTDRFLEKTPTLSENETEYINYVLEKNGGNISKAATQLGLHRQSLQRKLKKYT